MKLLESHAQGGGAEERRRKKKKKKTRAKKEEEKVGKTGGEKETASGRGRT